MRRPALVRQLTRAPGSLILIVAPPGYGKSTLLSQWSEQEQRVFRTVPLHQGGGVDAVNAALEELIQDGQTFVLALDEAHVLDPAALGHALLTAVDALPEGCAVAVASRTEPTLPLGGLRARRALTEIRAADLALAPADAALLLRKAGLRVDFEAVQELVGRTEGWPAGLYLAALALREQPDLSSALEEFGGEDHRVAEFLRDEVMSTLRPDLARFALSSSVLGELSGRVCDSVLDRTDSGTTLTELAGMNSFLHPVDPAHERFRWHPMFRQALSAELRRSAPKLDVELHLRAVDWFGRHGDVEQAIGHAVSAHDCARAGEVLWSHILSYLGRGRTDIVRHWLDGFSEGEISDSAPLALSAAYSLLMAGQVDQARHWSAVAAATRDRAASDEEPRSMAAGLSSIEAALSQRPKDMCRLVEGALQAEPKDSPWRPLGLLLRGVGRHLMGDYPKACESLQDAVDLSQAEAPLIALIGLAQLAMIALQRRDWDCAADLTDRAERLIRRDRLQDCPAAALAFAACAASRAHEGRSDEAKEALRTGIDLLASLGDWIPWYGAQARILLAHSSLWLADIVGARTLLAEASRLARRTPESTIFTSWFDEAWAHMDELAETKLAGPSSLTIAELRVLRFLPSHRSFREIAGQLGVSANTVKTQAHAVYRKLGVASRSEAVAQATAAGLLGQ
ncbi:MAG: LuxR C-terminal-related transcriptional regulator [Solirubrobacteraceae bacterium]